MYENKDFERESRRIMYGISNFMDHESVYVFPEIKEQSDIHALFFAKDMIAKLSTNEYRCSSTIMSDEIDQRIEELGAEMEKDCS